MEPNRTSSFPAAIKSIKKTTYAVSLSIGMTLLTIALAVTAYAGGSRTAALILVVMSVGQVFLLSINIVAKRHIDKKNSNAGP